MRYVDSRIQQVKWDPVNFYFNDWGLGLLNSQNVIDIGLICDEGFEIVQEFILRNEVGKYADGVDIGSCKVNTKPIRSKNQHFGLFVLEDWFFHLFLGYADLDVPVFDKLLEVLNRLCTILHNIGRLKNFVFLGHEVLDVVDFLLRHLEQSSLSHVLLDLLLGVVWWLLLGRRRIERVFLNSVPALVVGIVLLVLGARGLILLEDLSHIFAPIVLLAALSWRPCWLFLIRYFLLVVFLRLLFHLVININNFC